MQNANHISQYKHILFVLQVGQLKQRLFLIDEYSHSHQVIQKSPILWTRKLSPTLHWPESHQTLVIERQDTRLYIMLSNQSFEETQSEEEDSNAN